MKVGTAMLVINVTLIIVEVCTQIGLLTVFFQHNVDLFYATFAVVLLSSMAENITSLFFIMNGTARGEHRLWKAICFASHFCLLGIVWRFAKLIVRYHHECANEMRTLYLFRSTVQTIPVLGICTYVIISGLDNHVFVFLGSSLSLLTASIGIATYSSSPLTRDSNGTTHARRFAGMFFLLIGTCVNMVSRCGSFVLFSTTEGFWVFLPIGFRLLVSMVISCFEKCRDGREHITLREMGRMVCLSYISLIDIAERDFTKMKCSYVAFYASVLIENLILTGVWMFQSTSSGNDNKLITVAVVLLCSIAGLLFKFSSISCIVKTRSHLADPPTKHSETFEIQAPSDTVNVSTLQNDGNNINPRSRMATHVTNIANVTFDHTTRQAGHIRDSFLTGYTFGDGTGFHDNYGFLPTAEFQFTTFGSNFNDSKQKEPVSFASNAELMSDFDDPTKYHSKKNSLWTTDASEVNCDETNSFHLGVHAYPPGPDTGLDSALDNLTLGSSACKDNSFRLQRASGECENLKTIDALFEYSNTSSHDFHYNVDIRTNFVQTTNVSTTIPSVNHHNKCVVSKQVENKMTQDLCLSYSSESSDIYTSDSTSYKYHTSDSFKYTCTTDDSDDVSTWPPFNTRTLVNLASLKIRSAEKIDNDDKIAIWLRRYGDYMYFSDISPSGNENGFLDKTTAAVSNNNRHTTSGKHSSQKKVLRAYSTLKTKAGRLIGRKKLLYPDRVQSDDKKIKCLRTGSNITGRPQTRSESLHVETGRSQ